MEFLLVQRMNHGFMREGPITKPEHLTADYMGSSEFEFGALPKAYKAMRSQKLVQATVTIAAYGTDTTLHVVAPADQADSLQDRFQKWADCDFRSMEEPNLRAAITKKDWMNEPIPDERYRRYYPLAWWALQENIFFSLDESITKMWLDAATTPEAPRLQGGPFNAVL